MGTADFSVATTARGPARVLTVAGEVDVETAPRLRRALVAATSSGASLVVVDLRRVSFLDSTGLGVLVAGLKLTREHASELRLVITASHILRVFAVTRLDSVFDVRGSLEDALG